MIHRTLGHDRRPPFLSSSLPWSSRGSVVHEDDDDTGEYDDGAEARLLPGLVGTVVGTVGSILS